MHPLAALALAGVVERAAPASTLRVTPRFLAHAEATGARRRLLAHDDARAVLESALATWDDYSHDARTGAEVLENLLDDRGQLGRLRPQFPLLEQFSVAA
jgi:hypothetical protein